MFDIRLTSVLYYWMQMNNIFKSMNNCSKHIMYKNLFFFKLHVSVILYEVILKDENRIIV